HQLYSLSKSFTSTAVGFAVGEGLLNLDDRVVGFFPEKLPAAPCANMLRMRVRDLLGMCTGHEVEPSLSGEDWVYNFLTSYVPLEPGSKFLYNTAATYMLSAILQRATGKRVSEYLAPRLFEPLGIENIWWERCPKGIETGGFGLNVKTEDIARFGQFLLNRGGWQGRQLIDPAWIDEATAWHIDNGPEGNPDWVQGYGYQFWRCQPKGVYRGDGAFGQYCVVMPEQDAVLAIHSGADDMQAILSAAWETLLPAMGEAPLSADDTALAARLRQLTLPLPQEDGPDAQAQRRARRAYRMAPNPLGITGIALQEDCLRLTWPDGEQTLAVGRGAWLDTKLAQSAQEHLRAVGDVSCAGAWQGDAFRLTIAHNRTPFIDAIALRYGPDCLQVSIRRNVSMGRSAWELMGVPRE
ncbi:MAG: serine hydrolase domain-containing protein, partial [Christensenellales bacterium]